jgi:putative Holliday junction resolvase
MTNKGRILAIDFGSQRVGLAISDEEKIFAFPLQVLSNKVESTLLAEIKKICDEKNVGVLLIGMPVNMDSSSGAAAELVKKFSAKLGKYIKLPVIYWDERLTTAMAEKSLLEANVRREKRKQLIDKAAAQLILQSYLDSISNNIKS